MKHLLSHSLLLITLGLSILTLGCGSSNYPPGTIDAASTSCSPGMVQLQIGDGFMRILCGCSQVGEEPGTVVMQPSSLTCHLSSSQTQVFFHFLGNTLKHQIRPVNSDAFPLSGVSDPFSSVPLDSYSFPLSGTGTYEFEDTYQGTRGRFIVP
jgi:hypothetical protein